MDDLAGKLTGLFSSENVMINQTRLEWIEQDLLSKQIDGEHYFAGLSDLTINWHYNESRAKREAPDMRQYRYDLDESRDEYRFSLRGDANARTWSALEDQNQDIGLSAQLSLQTPLNTTTELKAKFAASALPAHPMATGICFIAPRWTRSSTGTRLAPTAFSCAKQHDQRTIMLRPSNWMPGMSKPRWS
jgi:hypothetical protein